jgi:hypothetical protein
MVTPVKAAPTQADVEADKLLSIQGVIDLLNNPESNKNKSGTSVSRNLVQLDKVSARKLLQQTARDIQYTVEFTDIDIEDFLKKFKKEQQRQIEEVVKASSSKVTPGLTPEATEKIVESTTTTEKPSFFKPEIFAADYIWAKVNFKDEKTLGGKSLTALNNARSILAGFGMLDFSDTELYAAAKQIARGEISNDDFRSTIAQKAALNYPQYAERLKQNPGSTIRDLASPYINLMAKELELDSNEIQLDNMDLDRALRPDGTAGKLPSMSLADFRIKLRSSPQWENTTAANESARTAATALGRAFGYGV